MFQNSPGAGKIFTCSACFALGRGCAAVGEKKRRRRKYRRVSAAAENSSGISSSCSGRRRPQADVEAIIFFFFLANWQVCVSPPHPPSVIITFLFCFFSQRPNLKTDNVVKSGNKSFRINYLAACQVIAVHVQLSIHEFVAKWWQMFQLESSWVLFFFSSKTKGHPCVTRLQPARADGETFSRSCIITDS